MPVYLSLLVCAIAGGSCQVVVPDLEPLVGISACQLAGMQYAPQWQVEHPSMRVDKVRCTLGQKPYAPDRA